MSYDILYVRTKVTPVMYAYYYYYYYYYYY